jgi:crotonobetainyl-CoA:carnitine CoA-transferase CaiB-like acyl-CoA transferase
MHPALHDVSVLDFSHALAGPYCTFLLSGYGATVYKLESPAGDIGRGWGPPYTGGEASYFLGINAGKKGICIDLKQPEGRQLCLQLMDKVDVVIENFRIGTMDRLGLGFEQVRKRNPRLIYCSISGYGQDGPSRDQSAMDLILQASCGLISVTGVKNGETVRCGHSVADITAGMFAMIGILMALRSRDQTGVGQFVDVSMFDSMISAMASNFANYLGSGRVPGPLGTSFASIVPYRTFATADRDIAVAVGSEKLWLDFCNLIGRPELATHPEYATNALRVQNREVLEPLIAGIFLTDTAGRWAERLLAAGVPCSPVRTLEEVYLDPQSAVRQMFVHPGVGGLPVTGLPIKMQATGELNRKAAPLLGEHSGEALRELLQYEDDAIGVLLKNGILIQA